MSMSTTPRGRQGNPCSHIIKPPVGLTHTGNSYRYQGHAPVCRCDIHETTADCGQRTDVDRVSQPRSTPRITASEGV